MIPKLANNFILADTDWGLRTEATIDLTDAFMNANTIFTVTGTVLMRVLAVCKASVTSGGSATIELGITGNTAKIIAQTTATNLILGEIWHDNSPDSKVELSSVLAENIVSDDVILTVATAALTAGQIKFVALWYPLTSDGNVTAVKGGAITAVVSSPSSSPSSTPSTSPSSSPSSTPSHSPSSSPSSTPSSSPSSSPSAS